MHCRAIAFDNKYTYWTFCFGSGCFRKKKKLLNKSCNYLWFIRPSLIDDTSRDPYLPSFRPFHDFHVFHVFIHKSPLNLRVKEWNFGDRRAKSMKSVKKGPLTNTFFWGDIIQLNLILKLNFFNLNIQLRFLLFCLSSVRRGENDKNWCISI